MNYPSKSTFCLATCLLAAGWGPLAQAQIAPVADSLRQAGELVGSRPSAATAAARQARRPQPTAAAAAQAHLLSQTVDLGRASADDMVSLYSHFIDNSRAEHQQWNDASWASASLVLTHLNQRYEVVRMGLPLEDRLRIRSWQGEFRTLEKARTVKNRLAE